MDRDLFDMMENVMRLDRNEGVLSGSPPDLPGDPLPAIPEHGIPHPFVTNAPPSFSDVHAGFNNRPDWASMREGSADSLMQLTNRAGRRAFGLFSRSLPEVCAPW
jgi:hypothetical protein